ncbi:MAG TPA: homogentisate 1,2-dioxygenase [Saprospirales bacterium]|jgi:homogentisate 1,2-dioxygenase|nr:homogentisate 1,2-dioxygenase [Saprospiraceae bacterium]MDC1284322.1 homogentisate 1,2-dioxygenase [Saprospiraceae bacterium]HAW03226.1 homogentisate 1,2-dioxygenase [Saprospirales bacterium]|tara:strand:+ start:485 stop:1645 length:1161 start_codon:yes stop_codon:yes gene_type:complete
MPLYHKLGQIPKKRHVQFRKPNGELYYEQLFGTIGFEGMSSLLYHTHRPTMVSDIKAPKDIMPKIAQAKHITARKLMSYDVAPQNDFLDSRVTLLVNNDVHIGVAAPIKSLTEYFYKNADADEMLFIHKGTGTLRTLVGNIKFEYGDYLIIPRGMIYQIEFDSEDNRILYAESFHPIYTPKRYRNYFGQMLEHSPFCERDYKLPTDLETHDEEGEFKMKIKKQGMLHELTYITHPFDVIGWDGYNFPYGFSIHNFEPITGRVHQPPPVHQTFETSAFVICSFCPRLYDYHPQSIPAPYNHSNIDSDEMLYYVDGDFMSRNDIGPGYITLHPGGIPHGAHPGAYERSIGQTKTDELAVMIDTFKPLMMTQAAMDIDDGKYYKSWLPH